MKSLTAENAESAEQKKIHFYLTSQNLSPRPTRTLRLNYLLRFPTKLLV